MKRSPNLRRTAPPASGRPELWLVTVLAVAALLGALVLFGAPERSTPQAPFLAEALGAPRAEAPLVRRPAAGTTVRLEEGGYRVSTGQHDVRLRSQDTGGSEVDRFAGGVTRKTSFGRETVTVTPSTTEQFLTVAERQGRKTWRWELETGLTPRLRADGSIAFVSNGKPAGLRIRPVVILDAAGRDITPPGARWSLGRAAAGRWALELRLDDAGLPLPYVIDPAVDYGPQLLYPTRTQSAVLGGGATNATPGVVYQLSNTAPASICTVATNNTNTCPVVRENVNNLGTTYSNFWTTSLVNPATANYLASPQLPATGTAALGGFLVDPAGTAAPTAIPNGDWTFEIWTKASNAPKAGVTINLTVGAWIVTTSGTGSTATIASIDSTVIDPASAAATLGTDITATTTATKRTLTVPAVPKQTLTASQRLYVRFYIKKTTAISDRYNGYLHLMVNGTNGTVTTPASILHPTAVETPAAPSPTVPANNAWANTTNPTFSATYATTGTESGRLNVDLCPDSGCGTVTETLTSASSTLADGAAGTTPATSTNLVNGTYYRWRARGEVVTASNPTGPTGVVSSYSAVQRFGVDLTNPTGSVTAPAAGANVRGSAVTVSSSSADTFSGVASALFQRSPAGAGTWTAIGAADTVAPYSVAWDTTAVTDGLYDLRVVTTDAAGNTFTSGTIANVRVDNTAPGQSLALTSVSPSGSAYLSGTTVFYRGTGGGSGGSFRIRNAVSDSGSGPASSTTGPLGGTTTGWSHTPSTVSTPAGGPYDSNVFTWAEGTTSSPTVPVTAADVVGNTSLPITLTAANDSAAPTGGALTVNGAVASGSGSSSYDGDGAFAIDLRTDWTDPGSGIASSTLVRESATLAGDACGAFGSATTLIGSPAQIGLATGCYRYTLTGTDNVGNQVSISTTVKVDTSGPGAPGLTPSAASGSAHYSGSGTTVWFRPAGSGQFDLTASSTDSDTGVASYQFPALGSGWTTSGSGAARTYAYSAGAAEPGAQTVTATNPAGGVSPASGFTVAADAGSPTGGALTVNGSVATAGGTTTHDADGSFPIDLRTDWTDTGSGLVSSALVRESATLTSGACSVFSSATTLTGSPAQSGLADGCYRYTLTGTDNVGNTASISTVVRVDSGAPSSATDALAPYSAAAPITVTYSASDGGSGLLEVELWAKGPADGAYALAATDTSPASPSFSYSPAQGDGTYRFYTRARDAAGNTEAAPASPPDTQTVYDTAKPSSSAGALPVYEADLTFPITYTATDAPSGVDAVELWARGPADGGYVLVATDSTPATPSFSYTATQGDGLYRFYTRGRDLAGNVEDAPASADAQTTLETTPPADPVLSFGSFTSASATGTTVYIRPGGAGGFSVSSDSSDAGSGVDRHTFPSFGGTWTGGGAVAGDPATKAYTYTSSDSAPAGPQVVTATDVAGSTNAGTSSFTVVEDAVAPVSSVACDGAACPAGWITSSPVGVTLSASDGGSGPDLIRYTTDGSDPS